MTFETKENYWMNLGRELAQVQAAQIENDMEQAEDAVAAH